MSELFITRMSIVVGMTVNRELQDPMSKFGIAKSW